MRKFMRFLNNLGAEALTLAINNYQEKVALTSQAGTA